MAPHSLTACSGSRPQVADDEAIPELLHQLFERQAEAHPNHIALVCVGEQLTYGELERRANQFARLLRRRGIGRGECVGLWLPRSLDAYWAVLGILKAGAAYVPLDPDYPAERVRFILSDCQARALVTTSTLADKVTAIQGGFEGAVPTTSEVGEDRGRGREGAQNPDTRFAASVIALDDCSEELTSQN